MGFFEDLRKVGNVAYELSGVGDIKRGAAELGKGNIAGGLGRIALGTVGFLPVAGTAARTALAAGRIAKGSKVVNTVVKGGKGKKTTKTVSGSKTTTPKPSGVVTKVQQGVSRGVIPAKSTLGKVVSSGLTSPYAISRAISEFGLPKPVVNTVNATQPSVGYFPLLNVPLTTPIPTPGGSGGGGGTTPTPGPGGTGPGGSGTGTGTGTDVPSGFGTANWRAGEENSMGLLNTGGGTLSSGGIAGGAGGAIPGTVQAEGLNYLADLAGAAASSRARQYNLSDLLSRDIMSARGQAADIYGGRAPAIRGQLVTGAARTYTQGLADETQQQVSEFGALERAYGRAVAEAYRAEAEKIKNAASARSALAAQMRGLG